MLANWSYEKDAEPLNEEERIAPELTDDDNDLQVITDDVVRELSQKKKETVSEQKESEEGRGKKTKNYSTGNLFSIILIHVSCSGSFGSIAGRFGCI